MINDLLLSFVIVPISIAGAWVYSNRRFSGHRYIDSIWFSASIFLFGTAIAAILNAIVGVAFAGYKIFYYPFYVFYFGLSEKWSLWIFSAVFLCASVAYVLIRRRSSNSGTYSKERAVAAIIITCILTYIVNALSYSLPFGEYRFSPLVQLDTMVHSAKSGADAITAARQSAYFLEFVEKQRPAKKDDDPWIAKVSVSDKEGAGYRVLFLSNYFKPSKYCILHIERETAQAISDPYCQFGGK